MKNIIKHIQFYFLAGAALLVVACKSESLDDVIVNENFPKVSLSLENSIVISNGTNFILDNSKMTVPVTVNFTGSSPSAFTIQLFANTDTIGTLISQGTLPANTRALESGEYSLPPVVNVPFGVSSVTFDLLVSRSALERKYGKDVALLLKMTDPSKGNSIVSGKNTTLVVIKTAQAIAAEAVHYIGFTSAGSQYMVPNGDNYSMGSQDMTIPLELSLTGTADPEFTVEVVANQDTLTTLLGNGTLQNTVAVDPKNFGFTPKVKFLTGRNTALMDLTVNVPALLAISGKKTAIALTLKSPSKFQLSPVKHTIVVVIDPDYFRPYNITPFVIPGTIGKPSVLIPASNYDYGGQGVAYNDDGSRNGGPFRRPDNVDIADNEITVGWTKTGEWLTYSVIVEADGEYELNAIMGSPGTTGRYSVFFGTVNVTGTLASKKTAGSYGDQQPNLSTVQLKKGKHIMKFFMNVASYDVKGFIFTRKK